MAQRAARLERVDVEQFCRNIVMEMVGTANTTYMRPPGRPIGSLNVRIFARGIVNGLVESAVSMAKVPTTTRQYRKWEDAEKELVIQFADQKGSNTVAASILKVIFPHQLGVPHMIL